MLIDTHAHLDAYKTEELDGVINRAVDAGVGRIVAVGIDDESNKTAIGIARKYSRNIKAVVGYDRDQSKIITDVENRIKSLRCLIEADSEYIVAIGEIGLDFHYMPAS